MERVWAGIDAGKEVHWAHVLDASGRQHLSRKVENEESDLSGLIEEVLAFAGRSQVVWAVDQPGGKPRSGDQLGARTRGTQLGR